MRALIVEDGEARGALAAVRALGQAGWQVAVGSPQRTGLAGASRWSSSKHGVPPAAAGTEPFLDAVATAVGESGAEVVFGAGDAEVLALSEARDRIEAAVPYAPHEAVVRALDKVALAVEARNAGLPVPWTAAASEEELIRAQGPVIVKARLHAVPGRARFEAELCRDSTAARAAAARIREAGGEPILQERIEGPLVAYTALADREGTVVAALQQEAEATWPPEAGVSVRARTVPVDPELAAASARLLAALGWFGIAELQFVAPSAGRPVLIDLNGRFYGSLSLALAAGLNLPAMWAALATGRQPPQVRTARDGVRYQWAEGDLRRALRERDGILRTVAYAPRAAHSVWSIRDPAPSLRRAAALSRGVLRKLVRR